MRDDNPFIFFMVAVTGITGIFFVGANLAFAHSPLVKGERKVRPYKFIPRPTRSKVVAVSNLKKPKVEI